MKEQLQAALTNPNVIAFLRVIRAGESSQEDGAYHTLVGNTRFESLDRHPRTMVWLPKLRVNSSAAGAYQFLGRTWDECAKALDLQDFGKASQDLAAVFLIRRRGALDDVIAGRFEAAIKKCAKEWASLPESPYGQPVMTMAKAKVVYAQYGGVLYTSPERAQETTKTEHVAKEAPVAIPAVALALLPKLLDLIPSLGRMFSSGSEVSERNLKVAAAAVDVVKTAVAARNEQEAVEIIAADPEALAKATEAVDTWVEMIEAGGGGITGARRADVAFVASAEQWWAPFKSPSFLIGLMLVPLVYMIVANVVGILGIPLSDEVRSAIANGVVGLVLGGLIGYYFGQTTSRNRTPAPPQ